MLIFILQFTATLPPICHHLKTPLNMAFDAGWWQSGSKNEKRLLYYNFFNTLYLQIFTLHENFNTSPGPSVSLIWVYSIIENCIISSILGIEPERSLL